MTEPSKDDLSPHERMIKAAANHERERMGERIRAGKRAAAERRAAKAAEGLPE